MTSSQAVNVGADLRQKIRETYGEFFHSLSGVDAQKTTDDVLSPLKIDEHVRRIERLYGGSITGKKVLEIGSGFGIFTAVTTNAYGADSYGVEPSSEGFGGSFEMSQEILKRSGVDPARVKQGVGEALPFADNTFDIVYSSSVLEHVQDPAKVLSEAIRVAKPGGYVQIEFPNHGSFFDGHYACFYIPYQSKWFWKLWLKYVKGRDPAFVDTLRTELTYWSVMRMLKPFITSKRITLEGTGEDIFAERMNTMAFTPYAGLTKVRKLVLLTHRLKIAALVSRFILFIKAHTPLILSIRKAS